MSSYADSDSEQADARSVSSSPTCSENESKSGISYISNGIVEDLFALIRVNDKRQLPR